MSNEKPDVIDAYIGLLEEIPYSRILVKELVTRAGIPRSTFYLNYSLCTVLLAEPLEHPDVRVTV